jgi:hypothetical protein
MRSSFSFSCKHIFFLFLEIAFRFGHLSNRAGLGGLYRGAAPGILCGGLRNGVAMVVMNQWQRIATTMGLRD